MITSSKTWRTRALKPWALKYLSALLTPAHTSSGVSCASERENNPSHCSFRTVVDAGKCWMSLILEENNSLLFPLPPAPTSLLLFLSVTRSFCSSGFVNWVCRSHYGDGLPAPRAVVAHFLRLRCLLPGNDAIFVDWVCRSRYGDGLTASRAGSSFFHSSFCKSCPSFALQWQTPYS